MVNKSFWKNSVKIAQNKQPENPPTKNHKESVTSTFRQVPPWQRHSSSGTQCWTGGTCPVVDTLAGLHRLSVTQSARLHRDKPTPANLTPLVGSGAATKQGTVPPGAGFR